MRTRFVTISLLNLADALITIWAISVFGAIEANPLMSLIISLSPMLFIAIKIIVVTSVLVLMWKLQPKIGIRIQWVVLILFALVVVWNIVQLIPLLPYC